MVELSAPQQIQVCRAKAEIANTRAPLWGFEKQGKNGPLAPASAGIGSATRFNTGMSALETIASDVDSESSFTVEVGSGRLQSFAGLSLGKAFTEQKR